MHVLTVHAVSVMGGVCPITQYAIPLVLRSIHKGYGRGVCCSTSVSLVFSLVPWRGCWLKFMYVVVCEHVHVLAVTHGLEKHNTITSWEQDYTQNCACNWVMHIVLERTTHALWSLTWSCSIMGFSLPWFDFDKTAVLYDVGISRGLYDVLVIVYFWIYDINLLRYFYV